MAKQDPVREFLRKIGSKGGKNAAQAMTPEERSARAKKAVEAREAKRKAALRQL